jgi:mannose/cellobiose epimerase-like protein (N-acyl-D-glucosamine 2-epimerase family)
MDDRGRDGPLPQDGVDWLGQELGGFYYTLDWSDRPDQADRFWWQCAEASAPPPRLAPSTPTQSTRIGTGASGASSPPM